MGTEHPTFSDLDKSFEHFLNELVKGPIPDNKKKEIEQKLQEALFLIGNEALQANAQTNQNDRLIQIDMNKFNRGNNLFGSTFLKHSAARWASGLALFSAGLLFITIGFILIVTPASPEFEIATIFYFNEYDGLTVMDLFALVIIFMGIFLFIRAFIANDKSH